MIWFTIRRTTLALRGINNKVHISADRFCDPRLGLSLLVLLVFVLIQATIPAAATSLANAQRVRLIYDTHWPDGSYDGRWKIETNRAWIETEFGRVEYEFTIPRVIDSGGSPCRLYAKATAKERTRMGASIVFKGEVDHKPESANRYVTATAEQGGSDERREQFNLFPRPGYSEGSYPILRLEMLGGQASLVLLFRYTVEQVAKGGSLEYDIDRPGQDYKNFNLPESRPELCQAECRSDSKCKAFTYVKPGVQGPSARCWLKSGVPAAVGRSCCVSGIL